MTTATTMLDLLGPEAPDEVEHLTREDLVADTYFTRVELNALERDPDRDSSEMERVRARLEHLQSRTGGAVYRLPLQVFDRLQRQFRKFARDAKRIGVPSPEMTVENTFTVTTVAPSGLPVPTAFVDVIVKNIEVSPADGWKFIGWLRRDIQSAQVGGFTPLPGADHRMLSRFIGDTVRCEHCDANRRRKGTYAVEGPDGEIRQVGSTCLGVYTHAPSPKAAMKHADLLVLIDDTLKDGEKQAKLDLDDRYIRILSLFDPHLLMAFVAQQVRLNGFVAEFDAVATCTWRTGSDSLMRALRDEHADLPSEHDQEQASKWFRWAEHRFAETPPSQFAERLAAQTIAKPFASLRDMRALGCVVECYVKEQESKRKAAERAKRSHIGKIGERITVEVTITAMKGFTSRTGFPKTAVKMTDNSDNVLSWFASADVSTLSVGDRITIVGTVNKHSEFHGEKETVLSRCQVRS